VQPRSNPAEADAGREPAHGRAKPRRGAADHERHSHGGGDVSGGKRAVRRMLEETLRSWLGHEGPSTFGQVADSFAEPVD
jgi:hypothetical protein